MSPKYAILVLGLLMPMTIHGQYLEAVVPVGHTPVSVLWNPTSNKVYVANEQDNTVTIINGANNQAIATVEVAEYPFVLTWNSRDNEVLVSCSEGDRVAVIDGQGDSLVRKVRVRGRPGRSAYCPILNKLYVAQFDNNSVAVLDAGPDTLIAEVPLHAMPFTLMWHPTSNRVFVAATGEDSVVVIDCLTDQIAGVLKPGNAPYAWCWNPLNNLAYIAADCAVYGLNADGDSVVAVIPASGSALWSACYVPIFNKLYVGAFGQDGDVTVIDCATNHVLDTIDYVPGVDDVVCDSAHGKVYVAGGRSVYVFDARADTLLMTIGAGTGWKAMAWNWRDNRVYVADDAANAVYVMRDTTAGVAEVRGPVAGHARTGATVAGHWLDVRGARPALLLDVVGRAAARLQPGWNDVRGIRSGAYFLRREGEQDSEKIVIAR